MGVACILFAMIMQRGTHTRISITSVLSFPKSQVNPKKFPVCTHPPTYPHTHTHTHSQLDKTHEILCEHKEIMLLSHTYIMVLASTPGPGFTLFLCFVFMTHWGCMAK